MSRALVAAAAVVAALLVLGGAFFVGYVGELQRDLNDPAAVHQQAGGQVAALETALGYEGFLKIYRNYRLTGDAAARPQLMERALEAERAVEALSKLYADNPAALDALREARAIGAAFVHVAQTAPEMGPAALRGTAAMEALGALPQSPQLEAAYLSLQSALDRLKRAEQDHQLGSVAYALNWSQMLIMGALAALVVGLIAFGGLLQLGIIQPLKSLKHSLASVGDGNVGHSIWGAERKDEFGELARAGEKLRRSLTETTALKALAEHSQLRVTLEGPGSLIFEKLAAEVTSAAEVLKSASAGLTKLQTDNRQDLEAALAKLGQSSAGVDDATNAFRRGAATAIATVQTSAEEVLDAARRRAESLDQVAARFEESGKQIEAIAETAKESTARAVGELSGSTGAMKRLAEGAQQIQNAFFSSCDKISSDASNTTTEVRTLAARLSEAVGSIDDRLNKKLVALDRLELGLNDTLAKLQSGADDTIAALGRATGALDERHAAAETRIDKTVTDFEEIIRVFRDDETALQQSASGAVADIRAAQQTLAEATETRQAEQQSFAEATARLREIADHLAKPARAPASDALAAEVRSMTEALRADVEGIRGEIRDMAVRLTEDRLLSSGGSPFAEAGALESATPMRSLADVPGTEIVARLKDLAAEMTAAQNRDERTGALKAALGAFAAEVKTLAANADRAARLKSMGKALDHHAGEIEAHVGVIDPSAAALRTELHAITSELRTIAARAQSSGVAKDGPVLRESAIEIGARAESLFTYLDEMRHSAPVVASDDDGDGPAETIDQTTADIAALAQLIGRLEARAEHVSQAAVASRFDEISDTLSPAERDAKIRNAELKTGGAIHTVFESIERLNNIAAALARAGDAERQRKAAH
jgi:methyl-accepting chemotaxis protein